MDRMEGQFLRKLREERGLSLREFAEKVYTSKSTVQRWEQTALPDDEETFARVAEALGMSADQLRTDYQNFLTEREGAQQKKRENDLSPEQLAELKFGTKKLFIALGIVVAAALLIILLPILS